MADSKNRSWGGAFGPTTRLRDAKMRPPVNIKECELVVTEGPDRGQRFRMSGALVRIGKDPECEVALTDSSVSRGHAAIEEREEGWLLRDLDSTNGTFLNGTLTREAYLAPGATIVVGQTTIKFQPINTTLTVTPSERGTFAGLLGESAPMRDLFGYLARVARTELAALLLGETGTGKEVIARAIHDSSRRSNGPFIVFDCGAVEGGLVAAALFGHKEGAFTGAVSSRKGAFLSANGGTLFIDEVGELPLELQPKLLRALERREVQAVGADTSTKVDVRIVAATHRNLKQLVAEGKFRQDLYYRLSGVVLEIAPLRSRPEDVLPLARHFLAAAGATAKLAPTAETALKTHAWAGNVRELKNVVERAAALARGPLLEAKDLMLESDAPLPKGSVDDRPRSLEEAEKVAIEAALKASSWNKAEASRILGITPKTLREKIERYGVKRPGESAS
jgi:DNA-binding NtrC family response regulator